MASVDEELRALMERVTWTPKSINILREDVEYPQMVTAIDSALKGALSRNALFLPNLRDQNETIFVASDYGGESPDSGYLTYSFVVCAYPGLTEFVEAQKQLRLDTGLENPRKEIAFKSLGYGPVRRALTRYLSNLNNLLRGIVITVVVDKNVQTLWGESRSNAHARLLDVLAKSGFTGWKGSVAEKMLNIVHVVSYLVALLSTDDQKVFWMTDHDAIAANAELTRQLGSVFGRVLGLYSNKTFGVVGYATPFTERTIFHMDVLSCADLAAGTLEHFYTRKRRAARGEYMVSEEANKIAIWLSQQGILLKRFSVSIQKKDKAFITGTIVLTPDSLPPEYSSISFSGAPQS